MDSELRLLTQDVIRASLVVRLRSTFLAVPPHTHQLRQGIYTCMRDLSSYCVPRINTHQFVVDLVLKGIPLLLEVDIHVLL